MASRNNKSSLQIRPQKRILNARPNPVKGRIVAAGLQLSWIARTAKISRPCLSRYLEGRRRRAAIQVLIWEAFCRLSGTRLGLAEFWGNLLSERIAG